MATRKPAAPAPTVRVRPSPRLGPTEYVPGIPAAGIDLSPEDAAPLLEAGVLGRGRPPPAKPAPKGETLVGGAPLLFPSNIAQETQKVPPNAPTPTTYRD